MPVKVWIEHIILKFIENFSQISKLQNPENNIVESVCCTENGQTVEYEGDIFISSMPVNDLVADFSAASQELVASINSITESIDGITTASNDSAQGTTSIAQKTVSISSGSAEVMKNAKQAEQSAEELRKNVNNFVIE